MSKNGYRGEHGPRVRAGRGAHQQVEGFFSIFKRGIVGVYHHVSEKHLPRYLGEFDHRYNARKVTDEERAMLALKGAEGKRLTYKPIVARDQNKLL